jgi:hypothetical protein
MEQNNCLDCQLGFCINLKRAENELEGGELFVLQESINQKKFAPCCVIAPLECCCNLLRTIYGKLGAGELDPLIELLWQCFYDLRTSSFLAITAHYRGAIQLLRPVLENIAIGIYFKERIKTARSFDESSKISSDFNGWKEDKLRIEQDDYKKETGLDAYNARRLDYGYAIAWLKKRGLLEGDSQSRLEGQQRIFNEYLHTYYNKMDIGDKEGCSSCPALTSFNENKYNEWLELFQSMIEFIIDRIFAYYFIIDSEKQEGDVTDQVKDALYIIKGLKEIEEDLNIQIEGVGLSLDFSPLDRNFENY